ncbi:hypothetical protein EFBL_1677 [Effusibacillus lacus]|uniref:Uncharacterized protein n=2 Tax=Effusibacillus lacus TaxID=1348429 RepID=A0A292YMC2_9BACL|nr:hypothetical protein EDD64_13658 [Effusibacillus lacus]GAX90051.1 hypothetical protein EFBL_1677 [Effusibacillus lacus]
MGLMSQMLEYFRSPALKESIYRALVDMDCKLEKDKLLSEPEGLKADLYIEADDVIYLVKTVEKYQLDPLPGALVDDLIQAKRNLVHSKFKRVVPIILIGENTVSGFFLEEVYRNHVLVLQGTVEECAYHLEFILQHQVSVIYQMSPKLEPSALRFFGI